MAKPDQPRRAMLLDMARDLTPSRVGPTMVAGIVAGVITISYAVSLAALVFRGDLAGSLADGVGMTLWSTLVVGLAATFFSSLEGTIPSAGGKTAAVLAVTAASLGDTVDPGALFPTVLALTTVSTASTAVVCLLLSRFRLGTMVRYVPYPVVGGFMASAGLLTVVGGWDLLTTGASPGDLGGGDQLGLWIPGLIIGALLLAAFRSSLHRLVLPAFLIAVPVVLNVGFALGGVSRADAASKGWLLVPHLEAGLGGPGRIADVADADWSAVGANAGVVGTVIVLVVASLLLYAHALELATDRDVDLDRELRSTGWGSLVAAAGGGLPAYTNHDSSMLSVGIGGPRRASALVAALLAGAALLLGTNLLELFPTAMVGGLLIAIGASTLVEWVWGKRHRLAPFEIGFVLAIVLAVALLGFVPGTVFGIVLAVALFVLRYSRVSVIRHELTGSTIGSNVDRTPSQQQFLASHGEEVLLLELRGYVFFGTATGVVDVVERRCRAERPVSAIVFDFAGVTGVDSSTVVAFEKIARLAAQHDVNLVLAAAAPTVADLLIPALESRPGVRFTMSPDVDRALQLSEEVLLDRIQDDATGTGTATVTLRQVLEPVLEDPHAVEVILPHLRRLELEAGHVLVHQGEPPAGLFFLESGRLTALLLRDGLSPMRLRTMLPGTVVGEISLYLTGTATATVEADGPSVVWHLDPEEFARLGENDPSAAAALHLFVARVLADRVTHAEKTVRVLRS
jgi:SulP family sulfate permease